LIWGLGAPVVIGPLNGGMEYPPAFRSIESSFSRFAVAVGRSFSNTVNALLLGKRDAAVVLVANQRTREALPSGLRGKVIEFAENGVELTRWSDFSNPAAIAPIAAIGAGATTLYQRFLFMGRLVDWKALDIAIRAIERTPGAMLDVVGDGPMLGHWKSLAQEIRVADRVLFHGWQPQEECARKLSQSLALVLPSIYECGGAVVLEAMASGKPVIATRWGGPADYLDESCGILIDPDGPEALIAGFARAMQTLMASPQLCASLGAAGRQRVVRDFDWEKKVDRILQIYESVAPALAIVQPAL